MDIIIILITHTQACFVLFVALLQLMISIIEKFLISFVPTDNDLVHENLLCCHVIVI